MVTASAQQLRRLRGAEVAYVPQDPAAALNPALRIGTQLIEVLQRPPRGGGGQGPGRTEGEGRPDPRRGRPRWGTTPPQDVPAPTVGRPAAAGGPGHGVRPAAERDRARRADDRPGRDDTAAGAGHRAEPLPGLRRGRRLRLPRPGRRRGPRQPLDRPVRRQDRRERPVGRGVRVPRPSVHEETAPGRPLTGPLRSSRGHRRPASSSDPAAARVRVRSPLPALAARL